MPLLAVSSSPAPGKTYGMYLCNDETVMLQEIK